jgi:membrane AbrB-like protein
MSLRARRLTQLPIHGIDRRMPASTIDKDRVRNAVETLLVAAAGALFFVWINFPAGLICGSMLAVAAAALAGRPMVVPAPLARLTFFIIGVSLGAVVSPRTLHGIVDWPLSIALISVSAACMTAATMTYLRLVHGWDRKSALYGGSPGAMAQVLSLAAHSNADIRGVVIVQTVRVVFISVSIPAGLALFGLAASPTATLGAATFNASPMELLILLVVSTATAILLHWIRFPASIVFGAMLGSGVLHGGDFVHAALPWWIVSGAVVAMGATVGQRFANTPARMLFGYLGAAVGSFAVAASICAAFAVLVATLTSARVADLVISFAPGAQDTMMVLALSLNIDPVFVGAHQLARFLTVSLALPVFAHVFTREDKKTEDGDKHSG